MCLILPRKKVEGAVHRANQLKRAVTLNATTSETIGAPQSAGQQVPLGRVNFGGPADPNSIDGFFFGANEEGGVLPSAEGINVEEEELGGRGVGEKHDRRTADAADNGSKTAGAAVVLEGGGPAETLFQQAQAAAAAAAVANSPAGKEAAGGERQGGNQVFLTGVPSPLVQAVEETGNPPVTPMNISATLAKLQERGREDMSPSSRAPLSPVGCCPGRDGDVAVAAHGGRVTAAAVAAAAGGGERSGAASGEGMSQTQCHTAHAFSVGNSSSEDVSTSFREQRLGGFTSRPTEARRDAQPASCGSYGIVAEERSIGLSTATAHRGWALASRFNGGNSTAGASVGASADSEAHQGWHTACIFSGGGGGGGDRESLSFCCSAPSSFVFGNGDEERFARAGRGSVGTIVRAAGSRHCRARNNSKGLLNSLRRFVTSHVDPYKVGASKGTRVRHEGSDYE